jgi:hypothetical protein
VEYQRPSNKLLLRGMNLTEPSDRLGMEWARLLQNLRSYRIGEWRQRPGLTLIANVCADPILFGIRMTNPLTGTFNRFLLSGDQVFVDNAAHNAFSSVDSGYGFEGGSGVIARPDRSPVPYLFVASASKQGKFAVGTGSRTEWGLVAPTIAPQAELTNPSYRVIDECDATTGFSATLGAVSLQTRVPATAITYILYDNSPFNTAWASIGFAAIDENWQPGARLQFSGGNTEIATIQSVQQPITSTTIDSIMYDTGTTGLCTIQLALPTSGLERNSLVRLNGTETVRVLSVTKGLDGIPSFRCVTAGSFSAGNTVTGIPSIRMYTIGTHAAAETLTGAYVQIAVSGAGTATLTKSATLDLSVTTGTGTPRPIQDDDYVHISVKVADFSLITEMQIQFDIDAATNTFTDNYFFKAIRQPDLQAAISQSASSLTAQQQELQRQQIDATRTPTLTQPIAGKIIPATANSFDVFNNSFQIAGSQGPLSTPGTSGQNQWTELKIPVSEFQRVGSDLSRTWRDVKTFRITIQATAAVNVGLDSLWIGGTFGPNTNSLLAPLQGYEYCFVERNTNTGSKSNPSPPTRFQLFPERDGIDLFVDNSGYPDTQADVVDYYRRGGSIGEWHYLATAPFADASYVDSLPDEVVRTQPLLEIDNFKPWPQPLPPSEGTCNVTGTSVTITSGAVTTGYLRGVDVLINNQGYTLYTNPSSTSRFELNEAAGTLSGVPFLFSEPLVDGTSQYAIFGPYTGASGEFFFSVGDPINPGYVKWSKGNNIEAASDKNIIELCSPSESLMNGGVLDGVVFVWSNRRSWRILPSFAGGQTGSGSDFYSQETAMGKGLASKWALAFGDQIYFVSFDGVYATRGDAVESLTDESLAPLFRKDGNYTTPNIFTPIDPTGVSPISFASGNEKYTSLTYSKDGLYFTFVDTAGLLQSWFYSFLTRGWVRDIWTPEMTRMIREDGPGVDSLLAGSFTGVLYQVDTNSTLDAGVPINCILWSREEDWGDSRSLKQFGDLMIDIQTGLNTVTPTCYYDNDNFNDVLSVLDMGVRTRQLRDIQNGLQRTIRSVSLNLEWDTVDNGRTYVYEWQPAGLPKPETHYKRASDWDDGGYSGPKWLQGLRLRGDTFNQPKSIEVQGDEGFSITTLSVSHNGETTKEYSWTPQVTHLMRLVGLDTRLSREMQLEWIYEPEPPLATTWHIQYTSFDLRAYNHVRDMLLAYRTTSAIEDVSMEVRIDGVSQGTYTWDPTSGERSKSYQPLGAHKGKLIQFIFSSAQPFSLYLKDIEVRAGAWGRTESYTLQRPFGDVTRTQGGARV